MRYGKTSPRKFRLDKALVVFKCLVQLLSKCFMCRLGKHTVSTNEANLSPAKQKNSGNAWSATHTTYNKAGYNIKEPGK